MKVYIKAASGCMLTARNELRERGFDPQLMAGKHDLVIEISDDEKATEAILQGIFEIESILGVFFKATGD